MKDLIAESDFCINHNIEVSFIGTLYEFGLIDITVIKDMRFIPLNQLQKLEKMVRLYHELDINLEGIEALDHLLQKIMALQNEIKELKNKLRLYE